MDNATAVQDLRSALEPYTVHLVAEEASEAIQMTGKWGRFGPDHARRDGMTARVGLALELGDVLAAIDFALCAGLIDAQTMLCQREVKFARLTDPDAVDDEGRRLAPPLPSEEARLHIALAAPATDEPVGLREAELLEAMRLVGYDMLHRGGHGEDGFVAERKEVALLIVALRQALATPARTDDAAEERDALLSALGWKTGPFPNEGVRKVVLEDSAGLRPEMVKARRRADDAEADRDLWRFIAGDRVEAARSGLLIRIWNQMKDERKRRIKAEAALSTQAAYPTGAGEGQALLRDAQVKTVAEKLAAFTGAPYDDWRHFTAEAGDIIDRISAASSQGSA